MMQIKKYKTVFQQALASVYDEKEAESFFYLILEHIHHVKRIDLALDPQMEMTSVDAEKWEAILSDLKKQKPIQYILGETEFYGLRFEVDSATLIPRPETEELVEWILAESRTSNVERLKILDIGTGSGCIAIALAKNLPNAEVYAIDVSEKALVLAKKNAEANNTKVGFIKTDILEIKDLKELSTFDVRLSTSFDLIVSNPPYVRMLEKAEINSNVLDYEPHLALFVEDDDALLFYRKIAQLAQQHLTENGMLYFEINQYLGKEMIGLLNNFGFREVVLKQDIYGNDRMIRCRK